MKKFYLMFTSILMICLYSKNSFAQTETDTTFFTQMNYIFAHVDKSKVPYGILRDFGMEFTNIENYNGTAALADSNYADADAFWDVYQTLLTSRVSTSATGFVSSAVADSLWYIQRQPGQIVLSGLYFNYSRFKDNAAGNYITITNNQLYDKYVGGVWQNPYQSEKAFLISPPVNFYQGQSLQIVLPSNLWFTNNAAGITSMQLDAGDGAGYRTLTVGQPLTINYADTGLKQWTYKLTISGGSILYSHSEIEIQTDYSVGTMTPLSPTEVFPPSPFTATKSYLGVAGQGYATIQYANADHILRRPLIVAEGYDVGHITKPEEKFGESSFQDFITSIDNSGSNNLVQLLDGSPSQYDIIYVDWKNGTDYLQRNAYLLETIIQWVNANKVAVNGVMQPNVVLGQSMGGVIARYALKDMENTGLNHNTRLYISDDAPHQGANVPEGYQHLARHARGLYIRAGVSTIIVEIIQLIRGRMSPLAALSLADQPASKQMLINFVNDNNNIDNSAHTSWETELKNIGYPNGFTGTPFRKVAVSNGSECANTQAFSAGANLLTYNGKANTRILGDLAATAILRVVPIIPILLGQPFLSLGVIPGRNDFSFDFYVNAQADGISNQVYHGKITYTKTILWLIPLTVTLTNRNYTSNASTLPYDYFPGGYYPLPINFSNSSYQGTFFKYNITASNQATFNFVPTVSALDIGSNDVTLTKTDYLTRYVGASPPTAPKNTPFQNFITAFNDSKINEQHISIEGRNGDWIAAELNSTNPSANCSGFCDATLINGDNIFCGATSNNYTIPNLPAGATVTWNVTPGGIANPNTPYTTQTTLAATGNGIITLTATITGSCGDLIINKTNITVGKPQPGPITFVLIDPSLGKIQANVDAVPGATSYNWYKNNVITTPPGHGSAIQFSIPRNVCNVEYDITVEAVNGCGTSLRTHGNAVVPPCGFAFAVSPNPASNSINVAPDANNSQLSANTTFDEVRIYDLQGNLKKAQKYSNATSATINIQGLISGSYIVQITSGTSQEKHQLIIQN